MSAFLPGLDLSEAYYREAAKPVVDTHYPNLKHSAAMIGWGSEVLGYDDLRSTDHNWGPRFLLFLSKEDHSSLARQVSQTLSECLPLTFLGYPTNFGLSVLGDQRAMAPAVTGPVDHMIDLDTVEAYFERYLGYAPYAEIPAKQWLSFSEHKLLAITSGRVFHDGLGTLEALRHKFAYYPRDVWLYILASQWAKISAEETFLGRSGEVGDELGASVIAARQVKNLMRLAFILERRYAPYSKWFGTAFARLASAEKLGPILKSVVRASEWRDREKHLSRAYEFVAGMHNELGVTPPLDPRVQLHGRPYYVLRANRFAAETRKAIEAEGIAKLKMLVGSINQAVDSDEQISDPGFCRPWQQV